VVPRDREDGSFQAAEQRRRGLQLVAPSAMGEVAARNHEIGTQALGEPHERIVRRGVFAPAEMQVGDVENACQHGRMRLYTRCMADDQAPEIFDDLYLGLRAGGALRKRRRGEPLTSEEEEVIGRWQRLSTWRKAIAVGAFSAGTFGLGFTLGGLVFGRWRKA